MPITIGFGYARHKFTISSCLEPQRKTVILGLINLLYLLSFLLSMSVPYDDSVQKEWKERKGKIEGFYRELGQVGTPGNEKVSSIIVGKSGDKLVIQFEEGDGILYEIVEDMVSPLKMVKTVSQGEIDKFKGRS